MRATQAADWVVARFRCIRSPLAHSPKPNPGWKGWARPGHGLGNVPHHLHLLSTIEGANMPFQRAASALTWNKLDRQHCGSDSTSLLLFSAIILANAILPLLAPSYVHTAPFQGDKTLCFSLVACCSPLRLKQRNWTLVFCPSWGLHHSRAHMDLGVTRSPLTTQPLRSQTWPC